MTSAIATYEPGQALTPEVMANMTPEQYIEATKQKDTSLPRISINHAADDEDGNTLPRGHYKVKDPETGEMVYGKTVTFQPLLRTYSYSVWDNEERKFSVRTTQQENFQQDFPDTLGGMKCGKLSKEVAAELDPKSPEAITNSAIKGNYILYGLVSVKNGKTKDGKKASLTNVPCVWYVKGKSWGPISDYMYATEKKYGNFRTHKMELVSVRHQNGENSFFSADANDAGEATFGKDEFETVAGFMTLVDQNNSKVLAEHHKARKSGDLGEDADLVSDLEDGAPF